MNSKKKIDVFEEFVDENHEYTRLIKSKIRFVFSLGKDPILCAYVFVHHNLHVVSQTNRLNATVESKRDENKIQVTQNKPVLSICFDFL